MPLGRFRTAFIAAGLAVSASFAVAQDNPMVGGAPMPDVYGGTNPATPTQRIWRVPLKR